MMWTGPNDAPLSTKHERMAKLQQQLKGRRMINADDMQKIDQLFQRHRFEQSRGNPRFIVRNNGTIEAFTYADADTLAKALELFPAIVARLKAADRFSNEVESEVTSFLGYGDDGVVGDANVVRAVKIMRAKLKVAHRLWDAGKSLAKTAERYLPDHNEHPEIQALDEALAAFKDLK